jgi:hypothetical protein
MESVGRTYLLVASSRITTLALCLRSIARAKQNNWRCPWEKCRSSISTSSGWAYLSTSPFSTKISQSCTSFNADMMAFSLLWFRGSALRRTDPGSRYASCGRPMRRERIVWRGIRVMGRESIVMLPAESSTMRKRERTSEDLPLPVRPTTATFSPGLMEREKLEMTGSPGLIRQYEDWVVKTAGSNLPVTRFDAIELNLTSARPVRRWDVIFALVVFSNSVSREILDPRNAPDVSLELRPEGYK